MALILFFATLLWVCFIIYPQALYDQAPFFRSIASTQLSELALAAAIIMLFLWGCYKAGKHLNGPNWHRAALFLIFANLLFIPVLFSADGISALTLEADRGVYASIAIVMVSGLIFSNLLYGMRLLINFPNGAIFIFGRLILLILAVLLCAHPLGERYIVAVMISAAACIIFLADIFSIAKLRTRKNSGLDVSISIYLSLYINIIVCILGFGKAHSEIGIFDVVANRISRELSDGIYLSFSTWSTLGYGDVIPHNSMGRFLIALEAMIGYIFMCFLFFATVEMIEIFRRYWQEKGIDES